MKNELMKFLKDEDGLTMIEYAIAGGVIALGAAAAFGSLNDNVGIAVDNIGTKMIDAGTAVP